MDGVTVNRIDVDNSAAINVPVALCMLQALSYVSGQRPVFEAADDYHMTFFFVVHITASFNALIN